MNVEALMTKDVRTCAPKDTLQTAAKIMWDRDCGCVPVVDEAHKVVGMITDRDICMATMLSGARPQDIAVDRVMSREVRPCRPKDSVAQAENLLEKHQIRRLPVTDGNGRLIGLISLNDIAREAKRELIAGAKEVSIDGVAEALAAVGTPRGQLPAVVPSNNGDHSPGNRALPHALMPAYAERDIHASDVLSRSSL